MLYLHDRQKNNYTDMKKLVITLVAMTIAATSFAQVNFGVRAGSGTANLTHAFGDNAKSAMNLYAGAFADFDLYDVAEGFGIRPEFYLSLQGGAGKAFDIRTKARSYALNIPVMARYKFLSDQIALMVGPQFGFCLGGKTVTKSEGEKNVLKWDADEYKEFDFGFVFGGDVMVTENIGVEIRYNLGLTDLVEYETSQNRVFQLGVCYVF